MNIIRFITEFLFLGKWLRGYRSYIVFFLTFIYNLVAWLLDVRFFTFLCDYWEYWCSFPNTPEYNKLLSILSALAIYLRLDTKKSKQEETEVF
ncbi:MAG TPA: hypothetical protein PK006_12405 [Saprospiraceae bacterium]|nr:hypothetical protein [Saprospiraceae bacterium]